MNKFFKSILPVVAVFTLASCSENEPDPNVTVDFTQTQIEYDANGVWKDNLNTSKTHIDFQGLRFSHKAETSEWGTFWNGFCPSRSNDVTDYTGENWLEHQWSSMTGGGVMSIGSPYMVAYWNTMDDPNSTTPSLKMEMADGSAFVPVSMYINNTTYAYYAMINGTNYSKKFAAGDWTKVTATAVYTNDTKSAPLDIYLVDFRDADKAKWVALKDWTLVDLSALGTDVKYVYFTMSSSDSGQWGMNVPSYFAIDRPTYRK